MKIHLQQIPRDGAHYQGEEECALEGVKEVRCLGPLHYDLDAGVSEGGLWVNGNLQQEVELGCVDCLGRFAHEIKVLNFALHTELLGPETVDLTPFMREDLLLNLPSYPHCDRDGGRTCPGPQLPRDESKAESEIAARAPDWSALDQLKFGKN